MVGKKRKEPKAGRELVHNYLQNQHLLSPPVAGRQHLDDDELSAFTEGRLTRAEAAPLIKHLVDCNHCRHMTASLARLETDMGDIPLANGTERQAGSIQQLLSKLAARVMPSDLDNAVMAYEEKKEETEEEKKSTE
jgi:anti-sigma factor RsiW